MYDFIFWPWKHGDQLGKKLFLPSICQSSKRSNYDFTNTDTSWIMFITILCYMDTRYVSYIYTNLKAQYVYIQ